MRRLQYRVVLSSEILDQRDPALVASAIAALVGHPPGMVAALMHGQPFRLERALDRAAAEALRDKLRHAGVQCALEPVVFKHTENAPSPEMAVEVTAHTEPRFELSLAPLDAAQTRDLRRSAQDHDHVPTPVVKRSAPLAKPNAATTEAPLHLEQLSPLEEQTLFVGENFARYRWKFKALEQRAGHYTPQWHWPAFLSGYAWLLYRKMHGWAAVFLGVEFALAMAFPPLFLVARIAAGLSGNFIYYLYVQRALTRVSISPTGRRRALIENGGTLPIKTTVALSLAASLIGAALVYETLPPQLTQAFTPHHADGLPKK